MGRLFGTDGVRGLANADLTPELALALARAATGVLTRTTASGRPLAVVGRDPRASGELLEAAVVAGLASAGADVVRVGVVPTPAVAFLTVEFGATFGVMLSASHNPMPDNGIKFFDGSGFKLPDAVEDEIAARMDDPGFSPRPTGAGVGRVRDELAAVDRYVEHLVATASSRFDGLRVVVDCANGAAAAVAPEVLRRLGATVVAINAEPDGLNINDGVGSTHPEVVAAAVREHRADAGLAHDGDADRCIAIDASGAIVDGDAILAVCTVGLHDRGLLRGDTVVATVMANLGFKQAMSARGIEVVETAVGDRYVLEAMRERGAVLGGEQSGHVIFLDHATTGDGVLTAVQLLDRVAASGRPLAELAAVMRRLPQVLLNVPVGDKSRLTASAEVAEAVSAAERELGESGRVLVRPSGTESLVRVMVEAPDEPAATAIAERIAAVVRTALA